jgi:hypothetical protein
LRSAGSASLMEMVMGFRASRRVGSQQARIAHANVRLRCAFERSGSAKCRAGAGTSAVGLGFSPRGDALEGHPRDLLDSHIERCQLSPRRVSSRRVRRTRPEVHAVPQKGDGTTIPILLFVDGSPDRHRLRRAIY